mmetsp:Transcript_12073/g.28228  ORF Transcript_12073/g.28228 Transcript_12073/m.28228 type:complete len:139 (+) Transcript_12073:20-436(+)
MNTDVIITHTIRTRNTVAASTMESIYGYYKYYLHVPSSGERRVHCSLTGLTLPGGTADIVCEKMWVASRLVSSHTVRIRLEQTNQQDTFLASKRLFSAWDRTGLRLDWIRLDWIRFDSIRLHSTLLSAQNLARTVDVG